MLPDSQQKQNLYNICRLALQSLSVPRRFRSLERERVRRDEFSAQSSQSGFTIVEALLAIIVVTILMVGVAPVLVLATANRVQAKRVETAVNAAQYYISLIRSNPSLAPPINDNPQPANRSSSDKYFALIDVPRAGATLTCNVNVNDGYCRSPFSTNYKLFCVDGDGDNRCTSDSLKDVLIQAFGYQAKPQIGEPDAVKAAQGYVLGIRVYRADAFQDGGSLQKSSSTKNAQSRTYTGGLGNRKAPLLETTAQIVTGETTYDNLCNQIGDGKGCGQ